MEELPPMSAVLYPPVEPYESGLLEVPDGQSLYWETVGNPAGVPVLYLHGGPGAGCTVGARRFFDPETFRAVLFDQRGCGRSLPLASSPDVDLTVNTTAHISTTSSVFVNISVSNDGSFPAFLGASVWVWCTPKRFPSG